MALSRAAIKIIHRAIDSLFEKAKVRFLGPSFAKKREIVLSYRHDLTLPGLYAAASAEERNVPNEDFLNSLLKIAGGYLDAQCESTKARVVKAIDSTLRDAKTKKIKTNLPTVLGGQLSEVWKKTTQDLHRIVDTEATTVRNAGVLDGIVKVNLASGIEDPVVYFVVVRDGSLCDECRRLHLREDGVTPRVWRLSEVSHGYHKKGDESPSLSGLHPTCRCSMVTLMPEYGFKDGFVTYIGSGHDELARQRG